MILQNRGLEKYYKGRCTSQIKIIFFTKPKPTIYFQLRIRRVTLSQKKDKIIPYLILLEHKHITFLQ